MRLLQVDAPDSVALPSQPVDTAHTQEIVDSSANESQGLRLLRVGGDVGIGSEVGTNRRQDAASQLIDKDAPFKGFERRQPNAFQASLVRTGAHSSPFWDSSRLAGPRFCLSLSLSSHKYVSRKL